MSAKKEESLGAVYATLAFLFWGFAPIYFKWLSRVPATEVLAHRIAWSLVLLAAILLLKGGWSRLRGSLALLRAAPLLLLSACFIATNWGLFIYAILSNQILQTSLGYYINPLVNVLLGTLFLREKLRGLQWLAVTLAGVGTLNLALGYGQVPWLALVLAFSFGFYGLTRKVAAVEPLGGLFIETGLLTPVALGYLLYLHAQSTAAFGQLTPDTDLLLVGTGLITTLPLLWFNNAARRLPLTVLGFFQYLAPTVSFLLAVFVYDEPFTSAHGVTFGLIWAAITLFSLDTILVRRRAWVWRDLESRPAQRERES